MIIQLRGTSGSGKTHTMRRIIQKIGKLDEWEPKYARNHSQDIIDIFGEKRKKPLYYVNRLPDNRAVILLGHYDSTCGGCDNIGSAPRVYALYQLMHEKAIILSEGLLLSEDTKWSLQLDPERLRPIFLRTPIDTCIDQINDRRAAAGNDEPVNETATRKRVKTIEKAQRKLRDAGFKTFRTNSNGAVKLVSKWMGL